MSELEVDQLKQAIESHHGGTATFVNTLPVREHFTGHHVWHCTVHIFDLAGHPNAFRAYAWSLPVEGSNKRRFYAVLHTPVIDSPANAVRAAIVAQHRTSK